ncbi:MAG: ABC transporter ATP-binding protein [Desulfobulbaceae bacterium]|nr:ABC transporter ATP-binding protein [Desulfobulbaceae bacterium]
MKIRIEHLCKSYNLPGNENLSVLHDINLSIKSGDFVVILGASGSGKSTFLSLLAGLTTPTSGKIWVQENEGPEKEITAPHPSRSLLFQQPSLLPWLTVAGNIAFGCKIRGEGNDLSYQVNQFIEMMGLYEFAQTHPPKLSVGMAQRVCLARALIGRPKALLLDEPFGSLDTLNRTHLQQELINIWMGEKFTTVFVTHDIEEALLLGNRIVLLGGRPSTVKDVFDIPLDYPRSLEDDSFFETKKDILKAFRCAIANECD